MSDSNAQPFDLESNALPLRQPSREACQIEGMKASYSFTVPGSSFAAVPTHQRRLASADCACGGGQSRRLICPPLPTPRTRTTHHDARLPLIWGGSSQQSRAAAAAGAARGRGGRRQRAKPSKPAEVLAVSPGHNPPPRQDALTERWVAGANESPPRGGCNNRRLRCALDRSPGAWGRVRVPCCRPPRDARAPRPNCTPALETHSQLAFAC